MTSHGRADRGAEHLVPCLDLPRHDVFVGVKTGKKYVTGHLVYLGPRDVGTDEILAKLQMTETATESDIEALESFLHALQAFKIGDVVSVSFQTPGSCVLKKESERQVFDEPKRKLP